MKTRQGFTLVEILITITVMVILLTLAVVNLQSSQVDARNAERRADVESIARHLDSNYQNGYNVGGTTYYRGSYPPGSTFDSNQIDSNIEILFGELPASTLIDPSKDSAASSSTYATNSSTGTDGSNSSTRVMPFPSTQWPYVYQPLDCAGGGFDPVTCRKFNLYAWVEGTNTAIRIGSKHR